MAKQKKIATQIHTLSAPADFMHRALVHGLGVLGLLITICFFTATYDTAQVKLTLLHMGSILLLLLWAADCIDRRKNPFTRPRLPFLAPVLVYLGWNVICYLFAPYHLEASEEFIRLLLCGGITLLAATELTEKDLPTLTNYILISAWIAFLYAGLQILNSFVPGADPFNWRGFFTNRVFSTHANPNFFADFVVFSSCIIASAYLLSRKKSLLVLLGLGAISLFFTESKGAWLAYAAAAAGAAVVYVNTLADRLKKHRTKINIMACIVLLSALLLAGYFSAKRFQSVSFRAHTWLGAFEMIKDAPVLGVGTGNFKVIYSAYRRPQIFYIEQAHNVETQHAENELLEQAAVTGIPGLAIFLWMMGFVFYLAWRRLKDSGDQTSAQTRNLYLWGYTAALGGMFVHSWVDISVHFASSGFFFALFIGVILALCQPHEQFSPEIISVQKSMYIVVWQVLLCGLWLILSGILLYQFHEITAPISLHTLGEILLWIISWAVLIGVLIAGGYLVLRSALQLRRPVAILSLCLIPPLLYGAFSLFRANHYYSLGITFVQLGNTDGAITYFTKAVRANPLQAEYRQFRANVLANLLQLEQTFAPNRGDTKAPSNDLERALRDFDAVAKVSPNHPLLHHNRGQLHYVVALRRSDDATRAHSQTEYDWLKEEALQQMALAKASFERSLVTDPVNAQTYAFLIQIALLENDLDRAQLWIDRYHQGPDGVTEEEFLKPLRTNAQIQALQAQINARKARR